MQCCLRLWPKLFQELDYDAYQHEECCLERQLSRFWNRVSASSKGCGARKQSIWENITLTQWTVWSPGRGSRNSTTEEEMRKLNSILSVLLVLQSLYSDILWESRKHPSPRPLGCRDVPIPQDRFRIAEYEVCRHWTSLSFPTDSPGISMKTALNTCHYFLAPLCFHKHPAVSICTCYRYTL